MPRGCCCAEAASQEDSNASPDKDSNARVLRHSLIHWCGRSVALRDGVRGALVCFSDTYKRTESCMRGRWYLVEGVWVSERLIRSARPRVPSPVVSALSQTSLCHATCTGCPHSSPTVAPSGQQSGTAPVSRMSGGTGEEMRCEMRHASSGAWVVNMKIGRFSPPPIFKRAFRRFAFASNTRAHRSLSVVSIHTARCARWRPLRLPSRLC